MVALDPLPADGMGSEEPGIELSAPVDVEPGVCAAAPAGGLDIKGEQVEFVEDEIVLMPPEELDVELPPEEHESITLDEKPPSAALMPAEEEAINPDMISEMKDEIGGEVPGFSPSSRTSSATDSGAQDEVLRADMKRVLGYLDDLFDDLPEEKVKEFAKSEYYDVYSRLFKQLGI
jgi:hypothetical protein